MSLEQGIRQMQDALRGLTLTSATPKWNINRYNEVGCQQAQRPGFGKAGKSIPLEVNYFRLACSVSQAFRYDVSMSVIGVPEGAASQAKPGVQGELGWSTKVRESELRPDCINMYVECVPGQDASGL